jgi:N-methylhydantoinase B
VLHGSFGRTATPPWGAEGGADGSRNALEVIGAAGAARLARTPHFPLRRADRVRIVTGGGGGWGDPRERAPAAVARDVRDGLIGAAEAAAIYGVAADAEGRLDMAETALLRGARP